MILSKECHERDCAAYDDRVDEGVVLTNEGEHMKAFPSNTGAVGMDLRDYFAAKAMPLGFKMMEHNFNREFGGDFDWMYDEEDFESLAAVAYELADAMIKARENK